MPKKSTFTGITTVPATAFFDVFGGGFNNRISKANLFAQIQEEVGPVGVESVNLLTGGLQLIAGENMIIDVNIAEGAFTFRSSVVEVVEFPVFSASVTIPPPASAPYIIANINSSGGSVTINLDTGFKAGQRIYVADATSDWEANNCTVDFAGSGYAYYGETGGPGEPGIYTGTLDRTVAEFLYTGTTTGFIGG